MQGLDLSEGTLCSDIANVRMWVMSALEEQQRMMLCVMGEVVKLRKAIEGSRRAHSAEEKVIEEGGEFSGGYSVQEVGAVEESATRARQVLGKPASPAEGPIKCAGKSLRA